jgi:outer membrane protein OmpA-like peptidoglycan-associated protein
MKYATIIAIATLGFMGACASAPKNVAQLDEARTKVHTLSQDPLAQEFASRELAAARATLEQAETALKEHESTERVAHLSYLAARNADIGQARIEEAKARQEVASAEAQRNKVLLESREQEVDTAKQQVAAAQASAAAQAQDADAARRALAELQAEQTQRGMVLTLSDVLFDTNAATLKPGAALAIDRLSKFLEQNPETRVIIEGHTDSQGSDAYNEELSRRRAQAVADELVSRGIESGRFEVLGRGEAFPVAGNETAAGRQQNRRVEIVFSDQSGKFAQGSR